MAIGDIIVSLDIGASKTAAVVGQVNKFNEIEVVGYGLEASGGIKRGKIINYDLVAESLVNAITEAEETSNLYINSAYVNIKGINTRVEKIKIIENVEKPDDGLSYNDIYSAIAKINAAIGLNSNEQVVDIIPMKYTVNERDYIEEPIGAFAKNFIIEANVVIADKEALQSIIKVMEMAELKVDGVILETLATSNIVLVPEEKEMGVLLLDVGAAHTEISIYKHNKLEYNNTLPVGGDHITNDIAISFNISNEEAEKLKRQYNLTMEALITNDHEIRLTTRKVADDKDNIIKCSDIVRIIEARVKEMYQITRKMLAENNMIGKSECIVITGQGISNISGIEELAVLTLKINQVRVCSPKLINVIRPQHIVAYGMVKYVAGMGLGRRVNSDVEITTDPSLKDKFITFLKKAKDKVTTLNKRDEDEEEE